MHVAGEIPQCNPWAQYDRLRESIDCAVRRVLDGRQYILGPEVESFEREFADYLGVRTVVGVASGTDALWLALKACGVVPGDDVVVPSHTAVASVAAVVQAGATPRFADVDAATYGITSESVRQALTPRTRAVVAVHLYGCPVDLGPILELLRPLGVCLIEDCAQAHGAQWRGRRVGSIGLASAFSFYPTKNLGAIGDGGCVATSDEGVARAVRLLRQYGWSERYVSSCHGWNSRLDELQAAILRVKLGHLDADNGTRAEIACRYDERFRGSAVAAPSARAGDTHVYHQYVIRVRARDAMRRALSGKGIGTAVHYPVPVHQQPAYRAYGAGSALPVTEAICREIISLPMFPGLDAASVDRAADAVLETMAQP